MRKKLEEERKLREKAEKERDQALKGKRPNIPDSKTNDKFNIKTKRIPNTTESNIK